ncbi:MAG: electron transfer flavoprotein subunit beta/FixA family protein [Bacteroidia bacterium]
MKILVCISNVPDTTTKISFTPDNKELNKAGVQYIINPYDELALTKALELNEAAGGGSVTVIHVGQADAEPNLRKALAVGADEAVRIDAAAVDGFMVAREIAAYASDKGFDLILCGRESIDYNSGVVAGMLGELLDWPSVNVITSISIANGEGQLERDIDGGRESLKVKLPFVASCQKELTEPRIPNMRGIMMARSKPLQVLAASATDGHSQVMSYALPPAKAGCKFLEVGEEEKLVELLHNEAKVI